MLCPIKNIIQDFGEQKFEARGVAAALAGGKQVWGHMSGEGVLFASKGCQVASGGAGRKNSLSSPEDWADKAEQFVTLSPPLWVRRVYDAISLESQVGTQNLCCMQMASYPAPFIN